MDDGYDVYFVAVEGLADKSDDVQFIELIAGAMELPDESRNGLDALAEEITKKCAKKPVLLLIDNYENVDEAKGRGVISRLTGVKCLHMIVTSRIPAGIPIIEQVIVLPPLEVNAGERRNAELVKFLKDSDSYRLLEACVRPLGGMDEWEVDEANAEHVKSVLETTSGIPLAIDLVAGRMDTYSWKEAAETLRESFDLMNDLMQIQEENREGLPYPERHLSMEACLNWSYNKLLEPAQRLFRAISLFANGFEVSQVKDCYETLFRDSREQTMRARLEEIKKSSLLSVTEGRWGFLPIVHRYARALNNEDEKKSEVEKAFITYWDNFVEKYSSSEEQRRNNLTLLEKEHGHLIEFLNLLSANNKYHDKYIANTLEISEFWGIERMWGVGIHHLNSAMEIGREKAKTHPDAYMLDFACTCNNLAILLSDMGDDDGAKTLYEEVEDIRKRAKS